MPVRALLGALALGFASQAQAVVATDDAIGTAALPHRVHEVAGLERPVEILVDAWGVPHIYAATHYDAFVAQGFNAARDRLWQIDLWRRRGLGRLAAVLGADYVAQDRANRLFLYRGDMYREWLAYGSDAKRIATAFVAGVNAFVALTRSEPALLPVEFALLGYLPARWRPEDVVRIRSHGLWRNVVSEVTRSRLVCQVGLAKAALWRPLRPDWALKVPDGLDPCSIPADVLKDYLLATAPVRFEGNLDERPAQAELGTAAGSNNWVIAPARTQGGKAMLANDPHRGHAVPSLRYVAHLVAPGLNVIGAGEPALPGISIGHNERIAFGLTIFSIDQEDLYFYPATTPVKTIVESIAVKDGEPVPATLEFTRHGPVVHRDDERIYAVRAGWLEPGMAPYFGSVEYMRAENWREFRAALNRWGAPAENQVYADVDGNIGYKPAGLFPRRVAHDGLLPVPGDGRYEWRGFFDMDALPEEYNPARGFIATANANTLPPGYPIAKRRVGFEWAAPWRQRRLLEVLRGAEGHTLEDSLALQRDYVSSLAQALVAALPPGTFLDGWDGAMAAESPQAAFFAVWFHRHLNPALTRWALGAQDVVTNLDSTVIVELAGDPDASALIAETLDAAWAETTALLGDDPTRWRWGALLRIAFEHPLLHLADAPLAAQMRIASFGRGGHGHTVNNNGFDPENFAVRGGASWRMAVTPGDWDGARMTNAPGQSGDPQSPFYDNLAAGWAADESFPLLYSRAAVERHAKLKIELRPAP